MILRGVDVPYILSYPACSGIVARPDNESIIRFSDLQLVYC